MDTMILSSRLSQVLNKVKKATICVALISSLGIFGIVTQQPQTAHAETVEWGASWEHGVTVGVYGWSNLFSSLRWHSSTVTSGAGGYSFSGSVEPGSQSKAQLWALSTLSAYYNIW